MKTIEEAAKEYAQVKKDEDGYVGCITCLMVGFTDGVEFAQQWIPVENELPPDNEPVLTKTVHKHHVSYNVMSYSHYYGKWFIGFNVQAAPEFWRMIEMK